MLLVKTAEIPEEGLSVRVADSSWFPDREVQRKGGVRVEVFLSRNRERVFVSGSVSLVALLVCDRCLGEYEFPQDIEFQVVYDLGGEDPALKVREHECHVDDPEVIFLEEPVIDLGEILTQQVILAVPQKKLCRRDCLGLCRKCGKDLNRGKCECRDGEIDTPFAVLGRLLKKDKQ